MALSSGYGWGRGREQCFSVSSPAVVGPVEWTGLCFSHMEKTLAWVLLGHKLRCSKLNSLALKFFALFPASVSVGAAMSQPPSIHGSRGLILGTSPPPPPNTSLHPMESTSLKLTATCFSPALWRPHLGHCCGLMSGFCPRDLPPRQPLAST